MNKEYNLGDYYWNHADILRGYGIPENGYDQRIIAFMAMKLLIDNEKLKFSFDYNNNFHQSKYYRGDTKEKFLQIVNDLVSFDNTSEYFKQEKRYNDSRNQETIIENCLQYFNSERVFNLVRYVNEIENHHLEMILDVYLSEADFKNFPKEKYKDLYEKTISRMKKLTGELTGQHFTQNSIIRLICENCLDKIKKNQKIAIYDPACGTGSMLIESYFYFKKKLSKNDIQVYGQEVSGQVWMLAKIFLEISEIPNIIAWGNTLTEPAFVNGINGKDSFDLIIANPPFGVDWKHNYEEIVANMKLEEESNFYVIKDKNKIITPKKSDGQFLFMLHIIKLMKNEEIKGKSAMAAIISSNNLILSGTPTSLESKIRNGIFNTGIVKSVVEQPKSMFTNTDISTHIWFLETIKGVKKDCNVRLVRTASPKKKYFSPHPFSVEKMKNTYSKENIEQLVSIINSGEEIKEVATNLNLEDNYSVDFSEVFMPEIDFDSINILKLRIEIQQQIKELYELVKHYED